MVSHPTSYRSSGESRQWQWNPNRARLQQASVLGRKSPMSPVREIALCQKWLELAGVIGTAVR